MSDISAINSAVLGIQRGLSGARKNAAEIAGANESEAGPENMTKSLVELKENQLQVAASAKVVSTMDQTIGTLLDTKA